MRSSKNSSLRDNFLTFLAPPLPSRLPFASIWLGLDFLWYMTLLQPHGTTQHERVSQASQLRPPRPLGEGVGMAECEECG
jgi:hypothetical protein